MPQRLNSGHRRMKRMNEKLIAEFVEKLDESLIAEILEKLGGDESEGSQVLSKKELHVIRTVLMAYEVELRQVAMFRRYLNNTFRILEVIRDRLTLILWLIPFALAFGNLDNLKEFLEWVAGFM
jgi:hypothetical protein